MSGVPGGMLLGAAMTQLAVRSCMSVIKGGAAGRQALGLDPAAAEMLSTAAASRAAGLLPSRAPLPGVKRSVQRAWPAAGRAASCVHAPDCQHAPHCTGAPSVRA